MVFKKAVAKMIGVSLFTLTVAGCASQPAHRPILAADDPAPARSSEAMDASVEGTVAAFTDALEGADGDRAVEVLSPNFESPSLGSYDEAVERLREAAARGWFADSEADFDHAQFRESGDRAQAGPVALHGAFGYAELEFELTRQGRVWQIAGLHWDQY